MKVQRLHLQRPHQRERPVGPCQAEVQERLDARVGLSSPLLCPSCPTSPTPASPASYYTLCQERIELWGGGEGMSL